MFRSWGRIGTTIGGKKVEEHHTVNSAIVAFEQLYAEKTKNMFGVSFQKMPGCYIPVELEFADVESRIDMTSDIPSKLSKPVQNLVQLLFDVDMMKNTMLEFELDTEKMPLGKLSRRQLTSAYTVLNQISVLIQKGASQHEFIGATNHFYSLVPHDFGIEKPPIIDTNEVIKNKSDMIESLMEIELAYNMLSNKGANSNNNPIDEHFDQLNTNMEVIDKSSEEFKLLLEYVKNTHAATHNMYGLEIEDIFKINRHNEDKRYKPFKKMHNRKLLWHGSRLTNFVGILSHGLKIAPPEAPSTGTFLFL